MIFTEVLMKNKNLKDLNQTLEMFLQEVLELAILSAIIDKIKSKIDEKNNSKSFDLKYAAPHICSKLFRVYSEEEYRTLGSSKISILMNLENLKIIDADIREKIIYTWTALEKCDSALGDFIHIIRASLIDSGYSHNALLLCQMLERSFDSTHH
jgi:uncharacterized protein Smg (DUF494 family)